MQQAVCHQPVSLRQAQPSQPVAIPNHLSFPFVGPPLEGSVDTLVLILGLGLRSSLTWDDKPVDFEIENFLFHII